MVVNFSATRQPVSNWPWSWDMGCKVNLKMMIDKPLFDAAVFAKTGIHRMDRWKGHMGRKLNGSWVASCPSDAPWSVLSHNSTELSDIYLLVWWVCFICATSDIAKQWSRGMLVVTPEWHEEYCCSTNKIHYRCRGSSMVNLWWKF